MSKAKIIGLIVFFSLLFVVSVGALEVKKTEFIIATDPYQNLSFTVIDSDSNAELQTFAGRARKFGEYRFTYYGLIPKISLTGSIVNNDTGETLKTQNFGPFNLGTSNVNLNLTLTELENDSVENIVVTNSSSSLTNESAEGRTSILGFVTGDNGAFSNVYYYVGAGALGLIILMIIFRRKTSSVSTPVEPNHKKMKSDKKVQAKTEVVIPQAAPTNQTSINETEKRITDIQKQLEQIRSEEKLLKLQKQLNQERQELNKLQSENDPQNNNSKI